MAEAWRGATSSGTPRDAKPGEEASEFYRPDERALAGVGARRGSDLSPPGGWAAWIRCMGCGVGPEASTGVATDIVRLCPGSL